MSSPPAPAWIVPVWIMALAALFVLSTLVTFLRGRTRPARVAAEIYGSIVTRARQPALFVEGGIADTAEGRLEAIILVMVPAIERLEAAGADGALRARALVERFVVDVDDAMREMGVGDLAVPKKVRKAAGALYDRRLAYAPALAAGDVAALAGALVTAGVTAGGTAADRSGDGAERLAHYLLDLRHALAGDSDRNVLDGRLSLAEYDAPRRVQS